MKYAETIIATVALTVAFYLYFTELRATISDVSGVTIIKVERAWRF